MITIDMPPRLWLPPKPAIVRPAEKRASFLPGSFPAGAIAATAPQPLTVQATNTSTSGSGTSHSVALPAGITAGDLLIAVFGYVTLGATVTPPAGWTLVGSGGSVLALAIYRRTANGSEGGTATFTTSASAASMHNTYRIAGQHASSNPEISAFPTTADPPSLSPSWGAANTLWLAILAHTANSPDITAAPANYTNLLKSASVSSALVGSARRLLNAASENPGVFTASGSSPADVSCTLAIRPAA